MNFNEYGDFAKGIAVTAGNLLKKLQPAAKISRRKSDFLDITTNADLKSEELLVNAIQNKYPSHNIITEESAAIDNKSDFTWVIDPLDGTKEYIRQLPFYNVSIALEYKNEVVVGVVNHPVTNEFFYAVKGEGAYKNDKRIKASNVSSLEKAMIWSHLPNYTDSKKRSRATWLILEAISRDANRLRISSADVTSLCYIALGAADGFLLNIVASNNWWDFAPGVIILKEAGGRITDRYGNAFVKDLTKGIVASNGKIHDKILEIVKKYDHS